MLDALASIGPNEVTRPFWEACARRELRVQRCRRCGRFRHPPLAGCPRCGSPDDEWPLLSGRGRVFSFTVVHHAALEALRPDVPYAVVVVELEGAPGARLVSNLLDVPLERVRIGMEVAVAWDEVRAGLVLPRFRAAAAPPEAPR